MKKEIDELKFNVDKQFIDLSKQFISLKSEINNSISNHSQITNNITNSMSSVADDQLHEVGEVFRQHLEKERNIRGIKKPANESELINIPGNILYLFSVRYQIETEIKRIMKETFDEWNPPVYTISNDSKPKHMRLTEMVSILKSNWLINPGLANKIMQINRITSMAIHGENISIDKLQFVQNIAPDLIATLRGITERGNT